jgi:RHS repeat-associated protein
MDEAYSYDANGNRTNNGYQLGANNQVLSDGTYSYSYDNEGNRTGRTNLANGEITTYRWDYRQRLTQVITQDSSGRVMQAVEYTYDTYDRRIGKVIDWDGEGTAPAETERLIYDGDNLILAFDESNLLTNRYLYGVEVDQVLAEDQGQGDVLWVLADHQGSVTDLMDGNGTVINHFNYDSFGRLINQANPSEHFRFGFTGREYDPETGLDYYRARYYDTWVGQFISPDPLGFGAGDANLYRYVGNSPTNFTDPTGMIPFLDQITQGANQLKQKIDQGVDYAKQKFGQGVDYAKQQIVEFNRGFTKGYYTARQADEMMNYGRNQALKPYLDKLGFDKVSNTLNNINDTISSAAEQSQQELAEDLEDPQTPDWRKALDVGGMFFTGLATHCNLEMTASVLTVASLVDAGIPHPPKTGVKPTGIAADEAGLAKGRVQGGTVSDLDEVVPSCFVSGTQVLTPYGNQAIENLKISDIVSSTNPESREFDNFKIENIFKREVTTVLDLCIGSTTITCSPEHPFWVVDQGWTKAKFLQTGNHVVSDQNNKFRIDSITKRQGIFTVYNIEVAGFHTYHVSELGILVHNKSLRGPWRGKTTISDGDLKKGWEHIDTRHVTGNHPSGSGDLFAPGTTRNQLAEASQKLVDKGTRISDPSRRMQVFEDKIKVNGIKERVRVTVDSATGEIITIHPVRSE